MDKKEKVAIAIIKKWFRKGNITRCMRDILPNSNLNLIDREEVAKIIHDIVRWKRWYDFLIEFYDMERNAETYFKIAINEYDLDYEKAEKEIPKEKYVAIRYSFSDFLANYLKNKPEFINHLNKEAKTTLCINFNKGNKEKIIGILRNEKINAYESEYVETAILTESRARYSKVVKEGYAHIQDESSQLISKITANYGKKILDYCAGNGGKTLAIASITRNEADIYVNDVNERKLDILKKRAMLFNANVKMMEKGKYDVVLVDAPCAGVGAARRNPEAKYIDSLDNFTSTGSITVERHLVKPGHGATLDEDYTLVDELGAATIGNCISINPLDWFSDDKDRTVTWGDGFHAESSIESWPTPSCITEITQTVSEIYLKAELRSSTSVLLDQFYGSYLNINITINQQ